MKTLRAMGVLAAAFVLTTWPVFVCGWVDDAWPLFWYPGVMFVALAYGLAHSEETTIE